MSRPKRITKTCLNCGQDFSIPQCRDWREHCCSSECKQQYKAKLLAEDREQRKRYCAGCGQIFYPRWTQIRNGQGRYCSQRCSLPEMVKAAHTEEARENRRKAFIQAKKEGRWTPPPKGEKSPHYKGRYRTAGGYVLLNKGGRRILEHRYVMEQKLGRSLHPDEVVHHINHDKTDNRPENLGLMTRAEHIREHHDDLMAALPKDRGRKINRSIAREIRRRVAEGETQVSIAKDYRLASMTVSMICRGVIWREEKAA